MSASLASRRPIYTVESGGAAGIIAAGVVGRAHRCRPGALLRHGRHHGQDRHRPPRPPRYHARLPCRRKGRQRRPAPGTGVSRQDPGGRPGRGGRGRRQHRVGRLRRGAPSGPGRRARSRDRPATGGAEPSRPSPMPICSWGTSVRATSSGGISLDPELSLKAIESAIAGPLGFDVATAAYAVHNVANASMAAAIRVVTVQRGIDPRDFTLVAFGGAGPLHAVELADTFGIGQVVIPRAAGVASAIGLITSDLTAERVLTRLMPADTADPAVVGGRLRRDRGAHDPASSPGAKAIWWSTASSRPASGARPISSPCRRRPVLCPRRPSARSPRRSWTPTASPTASSSTPPSNWSTFGSGCHARSKSSAPIPHPAGASAHPGSVRCAAGGLRRRRTRPVPALLVGAAPAGVRRGRSRRDRRLRHHGGGPAGSRGRERPLVEPAHPPGVGVAPSGSPKVCNSV